MQVNKQEDTRQESLRLFHFSEEADIAVFRPRKLSYRQDEPAQV
ncbi:hypothetical protein [Paenibacillus senegalensis]|nr:hypothetical protein [Paenibacillus senegalensis]